MTIAALVLARRRWPLAVLLASAATLQVYYWTDSPGMYPAVPLSVALATAWAASSKASPGQTFTLYALVQCYGTPGLVRLAGVDPAAPSAHNS